MSMAESRDDLETALMRAQIENLEGQNRRGMVAEAMPSLAAFVLLIVGAVAAAILINNYWASVVDDARMQLSGLSAEQAKVERDISGLKSQMAEEVLAQGSPNDAVNLSFTFQSCDAGSCSFTADSSALDVDLQVYGPCVGAFAFSGGMPEFGSQSCPAARYARVCSANDARTLCRFGPYLTASAAGGWWIVARAEGQQTVRYINASFAGQ